MRIYKTEYIPICLKIRGQRCLVIGGGKVALRKINTLRKFGAKITCISPELSLKLKDLSAKKAIRYIKDSYTNEISLAKYKLVIAATDNTRLNQRIASRCKREGVLINAITPKARGDVIMPAILEKKGLIVAVSTGGRDPSKAKKVRDGLRNIRFFQ